MSITDWELIAVALISVPLIIAADAYWIEKFFIRTKKFYIGKATRSTKNIRIVQVSDLHLRKLNFPLTRLAKKINKLKPDLIAFTGDAVDKRRNLSLLNDFLQLIDPSIQKVAILGNWEYQGKIDLAELDKMYARHNCKLLVNQSIQYSFYNKTISITGVDDYIRGNPDFGIAMESHQKSDHHIILTHCPQYSDEIALQTGNNIDADFILSGHTHGGQVTLFGLYIPFTPRGSGNYVSGWYDTGNTKLYVSKGIGTVFVPIRFGARAEIAIFNIAT